MPHLATCIFLFFYNEPELGVGIDPGMALTPLPSSIGHGLNPRPSDREPSAIRQDRSFRLNRRKYFISMFDVRSTYPKLMLMIEKKWSIKTTNKGIGLHLKF